MSDLMTLDDVLLDRLYERLVTRARPLPSPVVDLLSRLDEYVRERQLNPSTATEVRRTVGWYIQKCDETGHAYDSKAGAAQFKALIVARGVSVATINNHLGRVSAFLSWAAAHGYVELNPVSALRVREKKRRTKRDERSAVPRAVLETFLRMCAVGVAYDGRLWLPLILAYTGARLGEIAQLYLDDIQEEGGIPFFSINDMRPGQSLKTPESRRCVPVHSKLLELGLLERVTALRAAGEERLFGYWSLEGQAPSVYAGNWLRDLMKHPASGVEDHTPHAIRHSVMTALFDSEQPEWIVKQLIGHAMHQGQASRYDKGRGLSRTREAIETLTWL